MFTGIITHLGMLKEKNSDTLIIKTPQDLYKKLSVGMSVAVDGICFTVNALKEPCEFTVTFIPETKNKTNIKYLKKKDLLNLELPVTLETLFAGHIVQGHVDNVSRVLSIESEGNSRIFTFSIGPSISKYLVDKGSVAVNGISLTVIQAMDNRFTAGIIPHTWTHTMLHQVKIGDHVNIEVDILAKYLEKLTRV